MKRVLSAIIAALFILTATVNAQPPEYYKGDRLFRYENVHSGNKVRTVFYNYGLIGNLGEISGEWPIGTGNEYVGDVSILVGVEYNHTTLDSVYVEAHERWYQVAPDTIRSVITCLTPRFPDAGDFDGGVHVGFEPLPGFGAPPLEGSSDPGKVAMSNLPETWPGDWPDKMYSDPRDILWQEDETDPGWRGKWNGYFGKDVTNADQESYFQMDDNWDTEFRWRPLIDATSDTIVTVGGQAFTIPYFPTEADTTRGGLGMRVATRGFQWSHFLAEDAIIWQYEIANVSDYNYDKVVFGMIVGTLSGGRGPGEPSDDLAFFDPENDITYSWDNDDNSLTPGWVPVSDQHEVGWIGYAFLESPGNEFDGIDNDGDANGNAPTLTVEQLVAWTRNGTTINAGDRVILIDYETYDRYVTTMPNDGELAYSFRGEERILTSGQMLLEDGYNGFDDNFNGLIDERYIDPSDPTIDVRLDHTGYAYINYLSYNDGDVLKRGYVVPGLDVEPAIENVAPMIDEARNDGVDNDGDWDEFTDDVGFDGQPDTYDFLQGEDNGVPDNGEPHFDKTDVDESDQIGLTSFYYFELGSARNVGLSEDRELWDVLTPGVIDVIPNEPMDGDFYYGSGYFPLPSGNTQRFSTALFFGEDSVDVFLNKKTVQQIYNSNYNFARPPEKPIVTAVAGDGYVTLYWDDAAEESYDTSQPVGSKYDFEGYKVYRATDPGFLENFIITDGLGRKVFHKPIAQFDLNDGKSGYFSSGDIGVSYYLGDDRGLQHVWTDSTVENGQIYYYAVSSYDFGNDSTGVFPAETSKFIFVDETGRITTDVNTVYVTPGPKASGYHPPVEGSAEQISGAADCFAYIEVVDPTVVPDDVTYRLHFTDADELNRASRYFISAHNLDGDSSVAVSSQPIVISTVNRRIYGLYDEALDSLYGDTTSVEGYNPEAYFMTQETPVFDGLRAFLIAPRLPGQRVAALTGYDTYNAVDPDSMYATAVAKINYIYDLEGDSILADYRIEFFNEIVDTSMAYDMRLYPDFNPEPVTFHVTNLSRDYEPLILFRDGGEEPDGFISEGSELAIFDFFDQDQDGAIDTVATWSFTFRESEDNGNIYPPRGGDVYYSTMYEIFTPEDVYEFTSESAFLNSDAVDLSRIKVYPNPYLAANVQEPPNTYASGRGERRITFNHLPSHCTIRIYTVRGELVDTIEHDANMFDGTANWDLRNMDGLDIAYGIYVYHVESEWGERVGKFAVIK